MFYDNFAIKCNEKGISPTAAALEMGFHRSEVTRWKNGTTPRRANLLKMAKYFKCNVDDLTVETEKPAPGERGGLDDLDMKLIYLFKQMTAEQKNLALALIEAQIKVQSGEKE